ncbi:hypothetical protein GSI_07320 [Ganoderma sinense ZZ0214-1]|uniref:Uncharacterized protein n=1 Tax=Ganoderma sinense ZZ0214-1 TaxID=1077348 RepID=A0A2G8SAI8_9APHY|nr:hypothetical protein GSI_07320 [Ganoderma sinense ZZ0214-1]
MATLLLHPCPPGPSKGILLNPSPGASPAYHPASLPALIPSNSSLSSSASSLAPGDSSDYFSKSASSSAGPSHSLPSSNNVHLHAHAKHRTDSNPSTVRRIRFAPLPEPRRDDEVFDSVFLDDDDLEQPLTMHSALATAGVALAGPADADLSKHAHSVTSSPGAARKCLPTESFLLGCPRDDFSCPGPSSESEAQHSLECAHEWDLVRSPSPAHPASAFSPSSPRKGTKWTKMLAPLLGRSGRSHSSPLAMFSAEDVSTLHGDAHRGRRNSNNSGHGLRTGSSRESSVSHERSGSDFGAPLNRWTSEGAPGAGLPLSTKKRLSLFGGGGGGGVPLGRTQSLTSLPGKDDKKGKPAATAPPRAGGRKQTRMLNGRVYGAKRNPNAKNPFANVRTDEPEFVEWGYGGMGSVKNTAGQSSVWSRVQADNNAAGIARKATEDEDDGTGMAWVRKRKEERERAKREAEERAKKEQEEREANAENADVEMNTESEVTDAKETDTEADAEVAVPIEAVERSERVDEAESAPMSPNATVPSTPAPPTPLASDGQKSPAHITQAINIPAPHRHHHSHSHSYSHTAHHHHSHTLFLSRIDTRESGETVRPLASPLKSPLVSPKHQSAERASVGSSSGASTASDDGEDGDSEGSPKDSGFGNDEDSEEEDEVQERSRLTALSAGVEKIARHHKEEQGSTAVGTPAEASS